MKSISVFEIIKVGIGPSSSHTMGPWNAAEMFLNLIRGKRGISSVREVFVEFYGSLAKTGIGHGTDIAGMLGLSGENFKTIDTSLIMQKADTIKSSGKIKIGGEKEIPFVYGHHLVLNKKENLPFHPNGMIFKVIFEDGSELSQDYYSVGGGFVATQEEVSVDNYCIRTLHPCHHGDDVLRYCNQLGISFSDLIYDNEESWQSREETNQKALEIWRHIKECIYKGVNTKGILPGGLNVVRRAAGLNRKLLGDKVYHP